MILTGNEIKAQLGGNIIIDPFDERQLNPNSYNLRLHNELLVYEEIVLDMKRPNRFRRYVIPEDGLVLNPNQLYLGRTVERTETFNLVPMLEGRSSVGRLGLFVHITWRASATSGSAVSGRWRCSPCSRCGCIPAYQSRRSSFTPCRGPCRTTTA